MQYQAAISTRTLLYNHIQLKQEQRLTSSQFILFNLLHKRYLRIIRNFANHRSLRCD